MTRTQSGRAVPRSLPRYLAVLVTGGALVLTMAAATPASTPTAPGTLTKVATVAVGQDPTGIAADPATGTVYVTCTGPSADLYAINAASNTVTATIPVGAGPQAVAVNPVTDTIYTANQTAGTISVVDGASGTVTATIPVSGAYLVAVNPASNTVYAAGLAGLAVIDGATNTVTRTVSLPDPLVGLTVNPVTSKLYVSYGGGILALNANGKMIATIPTPGRVRGLVVDPASNVIYAAYGKYVGHSLAEIDGKTNTVTRHVGIADGTTWFNTAPADLAVDTQSGTVFVTDRYNLMQLSGKTLRKPTEVMIAANALPVAVVPSSRMVYTARYGSPDVLVYHSTVNGS